MKVYKIKDIIGYFGLFIDDEVQAYDEIDAKEMVVNEIIDNIGNYIDIDLEEIEIEGEEYE